MPDFDQLFTQFARIKVAVVGDVMLDTYWWGNVERISPEAPVPVVLIDKKDYRIGGAGNVALNLVALGATTVLFSVIGDDDDGKKIISLLKNNHIRSDQVIVSTDRPTTSKTRVISRNQHMIRLDAELATDISGQDQQTLLGKFTAFVEEEKPAVVIFEDYNKGVLTSPLIQQMIALCTAKNIITTVDPKKKNFFAYSQATIFKPNLKEVREGLNIPLENVNTRSLTGIHEKLRDRLQHSISLITLSEKGIFYQHQHTAEIIPTHIRNIADVSGAGDTVIAAASLVFAATRNMALAAAIANIAGGLVCEEVGTVPVNKAYLLQECQRLLGDQ